MVTDGKQAITLTVDELEELMARSAAKAVEVYTTNLMSAFSKNGRGGRHAPKPVLDTKTGRVYRTESSAGKAVAPEYGLTVHNFVWYELVKGTKEKPAKCPNRFKLLEQAEYEKLAKAQEEADAKQAKK